MKHLRITFLLAFVFAFVPLLASAAQQESKTFTLDQAASVGTQQLKPGDYRLKWDDSKDNTSVTFYRNNKEVATAPAHIVHKNNTDNASYEINTASGQKQLDRIYVANQILEFGNSGDTAGNGGQASTPPTQ